MLQIKKLVFGIVILSLLSACSKGPNDGIPAYVQIDSANVLTSTGQGSASSIVSTVWIESEGENVGAFEMPILAPILVNGERQIILNAGVFVKGDYFNREIYPAYQPFKTTVTFVPGETLVINPTFEYYDDTQFPLIEDFENGNVFAGLNRTPLADPNNLEGQALWIKVDNTTPLVRGTTSTPVDVPLLKRVYIEMDYKGDVDFAIGIESVINGSVSQTGYIDRIFASEDWYKIYYEISNLINTLSADNFNLFIEVLKLDSINESNLYIDNVKIVVI